MDGIQKTNVTDWFDENWPTVRCLSMQMAEFTFSAARAMASYGDGSGYWLKAAWDGANAVGGMIGCFPPPFEAVEDYVGVTVLQCQCSESPGQLIVQYIGTDGNLTKQEMSGPTQAKRINSTSYDGATAICNYEDAVGGTNVVNSPVGNVTDLTWYIAPPAGSVCCSGEEPPVPRYGTPKAHDLPEFQEGRTYTAQLRDSCIDKFGHLQNFYEVTQYFSDGSFADRDYYWESVDGLIWYRTKLESFEGFNSSPPYGPPHRDRVIPITTTGGGGGSTIGLSEVTYKLEAGCTWNEEEQKYNTVTEYDVAETEDGIFGLALRMDELARMINDLGLMSYTTCGRKHHIKGDPVTIAWISEEASSDSPLRLRKRTGYRSQSSRDSKELQEYFRDFSWEAGPVCVGHTGAWWGDPQVWAASEAEGKRVIRHLAGEAGLDPDQVGRWTVGGSNNARYGMTGTMRLRRIDGIPWVSRRQGSNMLPM